MVQAACCFLLRRLLLCCEGAMVWALSFLVVFPLRMLTAVDDDTEKKKLGHLVWEMQRQMEDLVLDNRLLQEKLRAALTELEAAEALLDEMEREHDDAFATIHALDDQLKALRQEKMRLNEHKGKAMWDDKPRHHHGVCDKNKTPPAAEEGVAPRAVARRRSLFSLGMSLAVGGVAWSADAPCLPLLAGLFAVVAVSMRSVSRLRRAAGADSAVALLSLNWFLLGVLTSPMLPGVAHAVVPRAGRALGPALAWIAAAAPL